MCTVRAIALLATLLSLCAVMSSAQILLPGSMLVAHVEGKVYLNEQRVEPSTHAYSHL
jgi:hypothetical protein